MKKTQPLRKLTESKVFWAFISLLMALALWIYIVSLSSDEYTRTFRGVPVRLINEDILRSSRNMVITNLDTNSVTVTVVGPRRIVSALSAEDIVAQVDVSRLSQAAYTSQQYTVVFPDGNASSLTTTYRSPETVNFMVSEQIKKQLPVRGSFEGQTADGFTAEVPVFEPSIITAFGPEAYLKNVDHAWVTFGTNEEVSQTYSVETGFSLQNKDGEDLSTTGLNFSTDVITATLPILSVKEVPLAVNLIDGGGATADNVIVSFDPVSSITLVGDSTLLAGKNKIIVATIDLSSFENSFSDTYVIPLDDGVRNQTGVSEVKVTVEVIGLASKTFTVTEMSCINVTSGYEASIISESINVKLRGSEESINRVQSQNIRAVADLTDYLNSTGTFMPEVKIYVDGFSDVGAIGNNTISIEIQRRQSS